MAYVFESNTLTIEDCLFYDDMSSNRLSTDYTITDEVIHNSSTPCIEFAISTYNVWRELMWNEELPENCIITFEMQSKMTTNSANGVGVVDNITDAKGTYSVIYSSTNGNWGWDGIYVNNIPSSSSWTSYKLVKTGTSYAVYVDNNLKGTKTRTGKYLRISYLNYSSAASAYVRNIKVKSA